MILRGSGKEAQKGTEEIGRFVLMFFSLHEAIQEFQLRQRSRRGPKGAGTS